MVYSSQRFLSIARYFTPNIIAVKKKQFIYNVHQFDNIGSFDYRIIFNLEYEMQCILLYANNWHYCCTYNVFTRTNLGYIPSLLFGHSR